jgi:tetratricopeptide (TPR) repeat protein
MGEPAEAAKLWNDIAGGRADGPFEYYRAVALRALGREEEALAAFRQLLKAAEAAVSAEVKIDYFATSLPSFLLFEDDLQKRNTVECLFVRGLAKQGLGLRAEAAADLQEALGLDRNHLWAQLELSDNQMHDEVTA